MKTILVLLVATFLLSACDLDLDPYMSNDEIIVEIKKCKEAGMESHSVVNSMGVTRVYCVDKEIK